MDKGEMISAISVLNDLLSQQSTALAHEEKKKIVDKIMELVERL